MLNFNKHELYVNRIRTAMYMCVQYTKAKKKQFTVPECCYYERSYSTLGYKVLLLRRGATPCLSLKISNMADNICG